MVILNIWVFRLFCFQSRHAMILLLCLNLCAEGITPPPPNPSRFPSPYTKTVDGFFWKHFLEPTQNITQVAHSLTSQESGGILGLWDELVSLCMLETPNLNRWIYRNSVNFKNKTKQNLREQIGKQFDAKKKNENFWLRVCIWVRVGVKGRLTFLGEALPTHCVDKPAQGSSSHLHKEPPALCGSGGPWL